MDNEQISAKNTTESDGGTSLINVFYALRARWLLIVIVIAVFVLGGVAYAKVRKPVYTATVPVVFNIRVVNETNNEFNEVSSTNYMRALLKTAPKFPQTGVTVDRTNVYYDYYIKSNKDIDEFMADLKAAYDAVKDDPSVTEIPGYEVTDALKEDCRDKYVTKSELGTLYRYDEQNPTAFFRLSVKKLDATKAKEIAYIFAFTVDFSFNMYFTGIMGDNATAEYVARANGYDYISVSPDMSSKKIVIVAAAIGVALALLTVFLLYIADNTVKNKEELEKVAGAPILAYIDYISGGR